jgi:hypothetical protein
MGKKSGTQCKKWKKSAARKKWKKKIGCNEMKKLITEPVLVRASVVGIAGRLGGSGTKY